MDLRVEIRWLQGTRGDRAWSCSVALAQLAIRAAAHHEFRQKLNPQTEEEQTICHRVAEQAFEIRASEKVTVTIKASLSLFRLAGGNPTMTLSDEAKQFAYDTGVRQLGPFAQKIIDLEATVKILTERVNVLEAQLPFVPPDMAKPERR